MSVSILFCSWNRLAFAQASFEALLAHTDWGLVEALHIHDDGSLDGSLQWLDEASARAPVEVLVERGGGGPVAAINRHVELFPATVDREIMVKVDNDFVVCPGWLGELLAAMGREPEYDICGLGPCDQEPALKFRPGRGFLPTRWVGGIGAFRLRAFQSCRPVPAGRFGFTEWQGNHPSILKGWLAPPLPCFNLNLVPAEPWLSLSARYEAAGWQRPWALYTDEQRGFWEWFEPERAAA